MLKDLLVRPPPADYDLVDGSFEEQRSVVYVFVDLLLDFDYSNKMKSVLLKTKIASRGWHFYGKTSWKSQKKGQSLYGKKENDKIALMYDPCVVAWKVKSKGKLIGETVGHFPKELLRAAWFFQERGGKISENNFEEKYRPSPIPKGGLEIMSEGELKIEDKKRKILERFQDIVENNYQNNENTGDYSICDPKVLSLQSENFGATPESQESENEEDDHLVDDEDDDVICLD